jgi:hypothetical protein
VSSVRVDQVAAAHANRRPTTNERIVRHHELPIM